MPACWKISVQTRAARRGGDKRQVLFDHEVDKVAALHKGERDIHAKGLVRELTHFQDLATDRVELTGAGFDNAQATGVADC